MSTTSGTSSAAMRIAASPESASPMTVRSAWSSRKARVPCRTRAWSSVIRREMVSVICAPLYSPSRSGMLGDQGLFALTIHFQDLVIRIDNAQRYVFLFRRYSLSGRLPRVLSCVPALKGDQLPNAPDVSYQNLDRYQLQRVLPSHQSSSRPCVQGWPCYGE